jgi:phage terminase large subunit-like protein
MSARPLTPSGKLSDTARHVVLPSGIVSTGWPAVRDTCDGFGVKFDGWQDGAGRAILAKRADGMYACSVGGVVLSIPRQVGKTFLVGAIVFALCLLFPGLTVIWTAHRTRTAAETFSAMQAFAKRKKVKPHISRIVLGSGDEAVEFVNGSRVLFGARERGFGLGFANVGVLVLDEAQRLTDTAVDDMIPTMNQAANPLALFMGTPPRPSDPGEVFSRKRAECLSGESDDTVYIEFSADPDAKPDDHQQWAKANPSYPRRTPVSAMMRMRKILTAESFKREALGIWDDDHGNGVIPNWADLVYLESESVGIASHLSWALTVTPLANGPQWGSIGKAGRTSDGFAHIEWVEHRKGTRWIVPTVVKHYADNGKIPIRMRPNGPEGAFIAELREAGVEVIEMSSADEAKATGALIAAASADETPPTLRHLGQTSLDKSVQYAVLRSGTDGAVRFDPKKTTVDITPLVAATLALGGVPDITEKPRVFAY